MTSRRRALPLVWFSAVALAGLIGFGLQFFLLLTGGADANSGETGGALLLGIRFLRLFGFFTIQSNLLVLVASVLLLTRSRLGTVRRVVILDAVLGIAITGLVFSIVLDPTIELRGEAVVVTTIFHTVIPIAFLLGWLLMGPRRLWSLSTTLWAFVWPVLWIAVTFVVGAFTGWYPYPFLDASEVGWSAALGGAGLVLALAVPLVLVVLVVDRRAPSLWPDDAAERSTSIAEARRSTP